MQSATLGVSLVAAHLTQTFTLAQVGVIQIAAVLHAQHGLLPLHPPYRAPAVRRQNVAHVDRRGLRLVDHAVLGFDRRPVAFSHATKGAVRYFGFSGRHLHQSFAQPYISQ